MFPRTNPSMLESDGFRSATTLAGTPAASRVSVYTYRGTSASNEQNDQEGLYITPADTSYM